MRMCLCIYKYMYLFKQVISVYMILIFGEAIVIIGIIIVAIKIIIFTIKIITLV